MITIFLIRHGEVVFQKDETGQLLSYGPEAPLSQIGIEQAEKIADTFLRKHIRLDAIFYSPFLRTKQTADILQKAVNAEEYMEIADLRDVYAPGWEGKPFEELIKSQQDIYSLSPLTPDQESLEKIFLRAKKTLKKIITNRANQSICIVSHGDIISAMVWVMKHKNTPSQYSEMKSFFYPERGEAVEMKYDGTNEAETFEFAIT